jgi:hypothetical protein
VGRSKGWALSMVIVVKHDREAKASRAVLASCSRVLAALAVAGCLVLPASAQQRAPDDDEMDDGPPPGYQGDRGPAGAADIGPGPDGAEVDVGTFYEPLEKFGRWFRHPRYGNVWSPDVDDNWRPYTRGHWANTEEYGWYWVAEEEWGWAPFHYGRWAYEERDGWLWIPGRTWAPAWVAWRHGDDHIGWAPLPPDAEWDSSGNINYVGGSPSYAYAGGAAGAALAWVFLRPTYMTQPGLWRHIAPRNQHAQLFRETRFQTGGYALINKRIYNRGVDWRQIARQTQRPVPIVRLQSVATPKSAGWRQMQQPNVVPIYRPRVAPVAGRPPVPPIPPRSDVQIGRPPATNRPIPTQGPVNQGPVNQAPVNRGSGNQGPATQGQSTPNNPRPVGVPDGVRRPYDGGGRPASTTPQVRPLPPPVQQQVQPPVQRPQAPPPVVQQRPPQQQPQVARPQPPQGAQPQARPQGQAPQAPRPQAVPGGQPRPPERKPGQPPDPNQRQ